jgi:cytochrome c5
VAEQRRAVVLFLILGLAGCGDGGGATAAGQASSPEDTYRRFCFSCHHAGAAGAPRLGDAEAWAARLPQGWGALMEHTYAGLGGMPARGLCRQCSDAELEAAVRWMLAQSGGLPTDAPPVP